MLNLCYLNYNIVSIYAYSGHRFSVRSGTSLYLVVCVKYRAFILRFFLFGREWKGGRRVGGSYHFTLVSFSM